MNNDNPPWDMNHQSQNPIDIAMPYKQHNIFDFDLVSSSKPSDNQKLVAQKQQISQPQNNAMQHNPTQHTQPLASDVSNKHEYTSLLESTNTQDNIHEAQVSKPTTTPLQDNQDNQNNQNNRIQTQTSPQETNQNLVSTQDSHATQETNQNLVSTQDSYITKSQTTMQDSNAIITQTSPQETNQNLASTQDSYATKSQMTMQDSNAIITQTSPQETNQNLASTQDSHATQETNQNLVSTQDSRATKSQMTMQDSAIITNQITTQESQPDDVDTHEEIMTLALKYRPKTFSELIGQESVARTLCLALESKKIAHGYLFSGLRGSGKTSSARIFARCLQCESGITPNPCGTCQNCLAALQGSHMDIIELDGASNRKIDDIRDLIEQTKYKPILGRFKVFIIDEVHMLTKEAFNSLLKTLEEPPSYVKFILATTDPLKIPATILSRTQHFRFKRIPINILKNHLSTILQKEHVQSDAESLDMIIRNGHGSVRDTLTLLDQAIVFCQNDLTSQKIADMLGALDPKAFDILFQALLRKDMQECIKFAESLEGYEIEMILDELSLYIKNKMLEDIPQIPPILGMRYANIINDSKAMLQLDCDSEFCLLLTILKMFEAQKIKDIDGAIKQLELTQSQTTQNPLANNQQEQAQSTKQEFVQNHLATNNQAMQTHSIKRDETHTIQTQPQTNTIAQATALNLPTQTSLNPSLQANIANPPYTDSNIESNHIDSNKADSKHSNTQDSIAQASHDKALQTNPLFQALIQKLYERDYEVGHIFEQKVAFQNVINNTLNLIFYTTNEETDTLRKGYHGIIEMAKQVFGDSVRLKVEKKSPEELMQNSNASHISQTLESKISTQDENNAKIQSHINALSNIQTTQDLGQNKDDAALKFIDNNRELLKNMKNELGVTEVKVIHLNDL